MKKFFSLFIAIVLTTSAVWAQCTPNSPTGSPGITPVTDSLDCIVVGTPYNETIFVENFGSFTVSGLTATVTMLRIDSITNIPCGLSWTGNPANATLGTSATGCLSVSGTSYENLGQYRLNLYITVTADIPFIGAQTYNGEAASVVAQIEQLTGPLGIDVDYYLRVTDGSSCPAIDRSGSNNLTASPTCIPQLFDVQITGPTEACEGDSVTLVVTTDATAPFSVLWSNGATADSIKVAAPANITVEIIDALLDTVGANHVVSALFPPAADFSFTVSGDTVTVTSGATNSPTSIVWDFDGQGSGTAATEEYVFGANGTYDITLTATNSCGTDDTTYSVTIQGVGIAKASDESLLLSVYPNPGKGNFYVRFNATENTAIALDVINLQGQSVYANVVEATAGVNNVALPLQSMATGVYFVKVQINGAYAVEKLVIE